jgi:hypothetical protein
MGRLALCFVDFAEPLASVGSVSHGLEFLGCTEVPALK